METSFPDFFADTPALTLYDPLAEILGSSRAGLLTYRYEDVVRLTGHSCPTVAGAWLMARHGLRALYPHTLPERGGVRVQLRGALDDGVTGVVGAVLSFITGAAGEGGFKGLGGRFGRRGLLSYAADIPAQLCMTRLDDGSAVLLDYVPERLAPDPELQALMARVLAGSATASERAAFADLWQARVRRILLTHGDDMELVRVRPA